MAWTRPSPTAPATATAPAIAPAIAPTPATATTPAPTPKVLIPGLEGLGFTALIDERVPRLMVSSEAQEKCGKTHWAGTLPSPMAVLYTDTGTKATMSQFAALGKRIYMMQVRNAKSLKDEHESLTACRKVWDDFVVTINRVAEDKSIRSVVIDTATDMYQLAMMGLYGKTAQIMPYQYGAINEAVGGVIKTLESNPRLNLDLIHRVKKTYVKIKGKSGEDSAWNGEWERSGHGETPYIVDVNIKHFWGPETGFGFHVTGRSRYESQTVNGLTVTGEDCNFPFLAQLCWPDTIGTDYWKDTL